MTSKTYLVRRTYLAVLAAALCGCTSTEPTQVVCRGDGVGAWALASYKQKLGTNAVRLPDDTVLFVGSNATDANDESVAVADIWDPSEDSVASVNAVSFLRLPAAATLSDGRVLVTDGANARVFDPNTLGWTDVDSLGARPSALVALPNGDALAVGSNDPSSLVAKRFARADGSWQPAGVAPFPLQSVRAIALADGTVLVTGSTNTDPDPDLVPQSEAAPTFHRAFRVDPESGTWERAPDRLAKGSITLLADERVLGVSFQQASAWQPSDGDFGEAAPPLDSRFLPIAAALADGRVLVLGTVNIGTDTEIEDRFEADRANELYTPESDSWVCASALPEGPSVGGSLLPLSDGRVVAVNSGDLAHPVHVFTP